MILVRDKVRNCYKNQTKQNRKKVNRACCFKGHNKNYQPKLSIDDRDENISQDGDSDSDSEVLTLDISRCSFPLYLLLLI